MTGTTVQIQLCIFICNPAADLQAALDSLADRSRGRTEAGEEVFELLRDAPRPRL